MLVFAILAASLLSSSLFAQVSFTGTVYGPDGLPLEDVRLGTSATFRDGILVLNRRHGVWENGMSPSMRDHAPETDENGRFDAELKWSSGKRAVIFLSAMGEFGASRVFSEGDDLEGVSVKLAPMGGVRGELNCPLFEIDGYHTRVYAKNVSGQLINIPTRPGHDFEFALPAGRYKLKLSSSSMHAFERTVDIGAGKVLDLGAIQVVPSMFVTHVGKRLPEWGSIHQRGLSPNSTLESLRGKNVLIVHNEVGANGTTERLIAFHKRFAGHPQGGKPYVIICLFSGWDISFERLDRMLSARTEGLEGPFPLPVILDPERQIESKWNLSDSGTFALLDTDGRLVGTKKAAQDALELMLLQQGESSDEEIRNDQAWAALPVLDVRVAHDELRCGEYEYDGSRLVRSRLLNPNDRYLSLAVREVVAKRVKTVVMQKTACKRTEQQLRAKLSIMVADEQLIEVTGSGLTKNETTEWRANSARLGGSDADEQEALIRILMRKTGKPLAFRDEEGMAYLYDAADVGQIARSRQLGIKNLHEYVSNLIEALVSSGAVSQSRSEGLLRELIE